MIVPLEGKGEAERVVVLDRNYHLECHRCEVSRSIIIVIIIVITTIIVIVVVPAVTARILIFYVTSLSF